MINVATVRAGDTLVWQSKCGDVRGEVKLFGDRMCVFTDETHCFPIELICCSTAARRIPGDKGQVEAAQKQQARPSAVPEKFNTIDEAPVLF